MAAVTKVALQWAALSQQASHLQKEATICISWMQTAHRCKQPYSRQQMILWWLTSACRLKRFHSTSMREMGTMEWIVWAWAKLSSETPIALTLPASIRACKVSRNCSFLLYKLLVQLRCMRKKALLKSCVDLLVLTFMALAVSSKGVPLEQGPKFSLIWRMSM